MSSTVVACIMMRWFRDHSRRNITGACRLVWNYGLNIVLIGERGFYELGRGRETDKAEPKVGADWSELQERKQILEFVAGYARSLG